MTLHDFTAAMGRCGTNQTFDHTWKEEDKGRVNPLNSSNNPQVPKFIVEEIKKNVKAPSSVVPQQPTVNYKDYGSVASFRMNSFVLPNVAVTSSMPLTPDIVVNTNGSVSYVEIKRLKPTTFNRRIAKSIPTNPMLFASTGTSTRNLQALLRANTYASNAIFTSPSNGQLMTFFHEGQIWNDVLRLLNFRTNNESLFIGAFVFSPSNLNLTINDMQCRLDLILSEMRAVCLSGTFEVFSEGNGHLNSLTASPANFVKASCNGFANGVQNFGSKSGNTIYGFAFEIQ